MLELAPDPWQWLYDLCVRCSDSCAKAQIEEPAEEQAPLKLPDAALRHALSGLGLRDHEVQQGVATVLRIERAQWLRPRLSTLKLMDPALLATLLAVLCDHPRSSVKAAGLRWLELPACFYHLPRERVALWAMRQNPAPALLIHAIEDQGLALLGPRWLFSLRSYASDPEIAVRARQWCDRISFLSAPSSPR